MLEQVIMSYKTLVEEANNIMSKVGMRTGSHQ